MAVSFLSPGVKVSEIDITLRPVIPTGTNVLVFGFAQQGPTNAVIQVANFADFQAIYGTPTNAAERYFYYTVQQLFNSPARVLAGRLPYGAGVGNGFTNTFTALVYPVVPVSPSLSTVGLSAAYLSACSLSATTQGYVIGQPTQVTLSQNDYQTLISNGVNWQDVVNLNTQLTNISAFGNAGFVVLNKGMTTIDSNYQGYYLGIADNTYINPATNYTELLNVNSVNQNTGNSFLTVPTSRLNFQLSAAFTGPAGSISQTLESITPFYAGGALWSNILQLGVFRLAKSIYAPNTVQLNYTLVEGYTGSLDSYQTVQNSGGGTPNTFYLPQVINNADSPNIEIFTNPSISKVTGSWMNAAGTAPTKYLRTYKSGGTADPNINFAVGSVIGRVDALFPLGSYQTVNTTTNAVGAIPAKLTNLMNLIPSPDALQIDVSVEAGLGTVYAMSQNCPSLTASGSFDDTQYLNLSGANGGFFILQNGLVDANALAIQASYQSVANTFINYAQNVRQDHIFVADPLRSIFVQGGNNLVLNIPTNPFSIYGYWPLVNLYGNINSSYVATYADWFEMYDGVTDKQFWAPASGTIAAIYANTDTTYQPWYAPAGFQRGVVSNVNNIAFNPTQAYRDMLYPAGFNPIANFPSDGIVVFGQKTLLGIPSAFDRVNVRRLFLWLEKATRATMKYFVFEPNTAVTRNRVVNNLTPIFDLAKNTQGIYDYLIICDERNNTPTTIDQNELIVDIYIKPVRAAEFILVNFYATQTSFNFSEITG